ncbi:hypothetical protein JMG10_13770 [Nostoc ellipsosporum NOK]|nr:hypothetical protein [Nostoc ellipsosporum NOK]
MNKLLIIVFCLLVKTDLQAQYTPKESMLGLRGGGSFGITYKKFFGKNFAFESILGNDFLSDEKPGVFVNALFEKHAPLLGDKFSALIGLGPGYHFKRKSVGASGVIGLDWRIMKAPLNLQVDWMPTYYFSGEKNFSPVNGAVSIRYILNSRKVNNND